jgi:hypothetical protein
MSEKRTFEFKPSDFLSSDTGRQGFHVAASFVPYLQDIAAWVISQYPDLESPIERMLIAAIRVQAVLAFGRGHVGVVSGENIFSEPGCAFVIYGQKPITVGGLSWRPDFTVFHVGDSGLNPVMVIECDGHEYHERTKDQAQRDRSRDRTLQEHDLVAYRFTGSEIFNDAAGCAAQVIQYLAKKQESYDIRWGAAP